MMTWGLKAWIAVLVVGLSGSVYWNYQLYEANVSQAQQIDDLQETAQSVEEVRAEILGQVEEVLGDAASRVMSAANAVEGRISSLEADVSTIRGDVDDMQGFGWSSLDRGLADLDDDLSAVEGDVGNLWSRIFQLEQRASTLESCDDSIVQVLRGWRDFIYC